MVVDIRGSGNTPSSDELAAKVAAQVIQKLKTGGTGPGGRLQNIPVYVTR
jgi:hypothetical protein